MACYKRIILVFIFFTLVYADKKKAKDIKIVRDENWPPRWFVEVGQQHRDECIKKTGVTTESISTYSETRDGRNDDDETLKCYMNCMFDTFGILDTNDYIDVEKLVTKLDALAVDEQSKKDVNQLFKMGSKCFSPPADGNKCEKAFYYNKCWKSANPMLYFMV